MRILLIEDDFAKRKALRGHLEIRLPAASIGEAISFRSAMDRLQEGAPDLVLLDMTIPSVEAASSDRDHTLVYGGRDVLRQMRRLKLQSDVIVVTQYEQFDDGPESMTLAQLNAQLREVYPEHLRGCVSFSFRYETWKAELDELLASIVIRESGDE